MNIVGRIITLSIDTLDTTKGMLVEFCGSKNIKIRYFNVFWGVRI